MPRQKVTPRKISHHGNVRYRVLIPKELGGGKRLFAIASDANDYARDLEKQRTGTTAEFFALSAQEQAAVLRAAKMLNGRVMEIEDAAAKHLKTAKLLERSLGEAVAEFTKSKSSQGLAPKSLRVILATLRRFTKTIGTDHRLSTITAFQIEDWLKEKPIALATRRTYLTDVGTFFSWCAKMGMVASNPTKAISRPRYIRRETKILSVQQCRKLMHTAQRVDPGLVPYLALALFAGIRPDEAAQLSWANVKEKVVEVPEKISKTRRRRLVDIQPNLRKWLDLGGDLPPLKVRWRLPRIRKVAGVPWPKDCLRHSFASYSVALHGIMATAHQCGNSEAILKQHYLETCPRKQAERFFRSQPKALEGHQQQKEQ